MFQFPGFPYAYYVFICVYRRITNGEFPHSDICGSLLICSSPQLFAACHVLLRRLVPRHPPYALLRLIVVFAFIFLSQFFELLKNFVSVFFPQQKYHICAFCVLLFDIFFFFVFSFILEKTICSCQGTISLRFSADGRLQWTRTTDPHLIRVVL